MDALHLNRLIDTNKSGQYFWDTFKEVPCLSHYHSLQNLISKVEERTLHPLFASFINLCMSIKLVTCCEYDFSFLVLIGQ